MFIEKNLLLSNVQVRLYNYYMVLGNDSPFRKMMLN